MERLRKNMYRTHLVIGDPHATPEYNNNRFDILGKFIVDRQPDVIVNIGDMASMESLCSYDKGKKSFEGRRYKHDVAAVIDAQERMFKPLNEYNEQQRKNKKKQYTPELYLTLGNHEYRINRAVETQAELEDVISVDDLKYKEFGWNVIPFLEPTIIDGIAYCHYFTSGVMGRPIGGEHTAHSLLTKMFMSCVQGHSHLRDFAERTTAEGNKIQATVVGCFLDEDQWEGYAGPANKMWYKGLVMLNNCIDGAYDPEFIGIKALKEKYGTV